MAEFLQIGNGIVAPLTYEIMERADERTSRMMSNFTEAMKQGELHADLPLEKLCRQVNKYY